MRLTLALLLSLLAVGPAAAQGVRSHSLDDVLREHVRAIQARDLSALERTITSAEQLDLIFPDGRRSSTRAEYLAFHRDWFDQPGWTVTVRPVSRVERGDLAVVVTRGRYEEREARRLLAWNEDWLTLTFARERDGWRLAHQQTTRIRSGPNRRGGSPR